jgi:hypothetical protein
MLIPMMLDGRIISSFRMTTGEEINERKEV